MSLSRSLTKKSLTILGLNSGTSADGLDMAAVRIAQVGGDRRIKFIRGATKPFPVTLKRLILDIADSEKIRLEDLIYLDNILGQFYGRAARAFLSKLPTGVTIDAVASHGQTVRHAPQKVKRSGYTVRGSLQIGSADFIAAATGKVVISDFRQADIALGNEGAPITVAAMEELFRAGSESRLIVNIGGMANYFYFPARNSRLRVMAADCGPGNSLSDILAQKLFGEKYDRGGRRAKKGRSCEELLSSLLKSSFYRGHTTSTGREAFGKLMAAEIVRDSRRRRLSDDDIMATAAELTVVSVARAVQPLLKRDKSLSKLYLTGGGKHNIFMMNKLRHYIPGLQIAPIDVLGIDGDYVEAVAYAVMGEACLRSRMLQTTYGKADRRVLQPISGKITQPPGRRKQQ